MIPMKNGLARGVRQASDFLMALQLTGAAKSDSLANLQVRLPVVVIGGGLTAIDTATESLAYYVVQVEKFLTRYETLVAERGEEVGAAELDPGRKRDRARISSSMAARFVPNESGARAKAGAVNLIDLLNSWGGVDDRLSPAADRLAQLHAESRRSREGSRRRRAVRRVPVAGRSRSRQATVTLRRITFSQLRFDAETGKLVPSGEMVTLPARSILVAAGTQPNTVLAREDADNVVLDGKYFQAIDEDGNPVKPERVAKPSETRVLMSLRPDGEAISFFGDLHPSFSGNVVKAMGSAKRGYPVVSRILARRPHPRSHERRWSRA